MRKNLTSVRIALQMQTNFARVIRKKYGESFEFRETNRQRFSITAGAQMMVRLQEKRAAEAVTGVLSKLHMIEVLRAKMASVKQAGLKVSSLVVELKSQSEVRHRLLLEMVEREREYLQTFYACPGHKQAKLFRMKLESLDVNCCKNKAILASFFKKLQVHFLLEFACAKYIREYASETKSEKKLSMWLERIKYYYCYHS